MQVANPENNGNDVLRVLFDGKKDKNMNVSSVLQKRQQQGKGGPSSKKQRVTAPSIQLESTKQKAKNVRKQRHRKLTEAHTQQIQRIHKFYTSEISSLQNGWEIERESFEATIQSLKQQLESTTKSNESLADILEEKENELQNYALLYNESTKEIEANRAEAQNKKSILSRLRMEIASEQNAC